MDGLLHAALGFLERGWTPLPIAPRGKQPLLPWRRLQRERPTPVDVDHWWSLWPEANVGIVTGIASGLAVLDLDGPEAQVLAGELGLPDAPTVQTGNGLHVYCALAVPTRSSTGLRPGVDLRADGGYVVAPPSVHKTGTRYAWVVAPDGDLPPLPDWATGTARIPGADRTTGWVTRALRGVEEGRRNATCARLAGYFLAKGLSPDVLEAVLLGWNFLNRPPLPTEEVRRTFTSIVARGRRRRTEALPFTEDTMLEFLAGWGRVCTHGEKSTYQAICVTEWKRGLPPGARLYISGRELNANGGATPQRSGHVLARLAVKRLIEFEPGRSGLSGRAATIRRVVPLPPAVSHHEQR